MKANHSVEREHYISKLIQVEISAGDNKRF